MATTPTPQKVLDSLPGSRNGFTIKQLARVLGISDSDLAQANGYLREFVRTGLAETKRGRFWRRFPEHVLIGTLRGTRSGHAFVVPDDAAQRVKGDLFVAVRDLGAALHGDKVIARVIRFDRRGREGRIEAVLKSSTRTLVGRFIKLKKSFLVSPIEEKFLYEISVAPADTMSAEDGDFVNVEITRPPVAGRPPWGRVVEVLGSDETPGIDIEIIIRKHQLPHAFPLSTLAEAEAIPEVDVTDSSERHDLRDQLVITIDGEDARDFDDAISLQKLGGGRFRLGVHIADVSWYVIEGSSLDEEAIRRGTSVYFPERAIPMLPERLSNGICSLNPNVDRLAISVVCHLDRLGRLIDYHLAQSVIRSRQRMTYTAVNEILADSEGETAGGYANERTMIENMHELAVRLIEQREQRGAIDFDLPEPKLIFNDEGKICGIVRSERNMAHRIIEEFMLLANEIVAKHLAKLGVPMIYRVHEEPSPEKVQEFAEIAASFGHSFAFRSPAPQRAFQRLAREIRGLPEERMLSYLMLRSMERARYSAQNLGHFGLAMSTYTHFTSPIRRYPDLMVHRILRDAIRAGHHSGKQIESGGAGESSEIAPLPVLDQDREEHLKKAVEPAAQHSSERERAADEAETELMDWRKAEFMAAHVGDAFGGVITSVKAHGFYVELNEFFVEGLVHVSTLVDDVYEFQERKHRLVGQRSGREFRLGSAVRVAVDRVDSTRHLIDFSISE